MFVVVVVVVLLNVFRWAWYAHMNMNAECGWIAVHLVTPSAAWMLANKRVFVYAYLCVCVCVQQVECKLHINKWWKLLPTTVRQICVAAKDQANTWAHTHKHAPTHTIINSYLHMYVCAYGWVQTAYKPYTLLYIHTHWVHVHFVRMQLLQMLPQNV